MKTIRSWFLKKLAHYFNKVNPEKPGTLLTKNTISKPAEFNQEFYRNYFSLIASGVRLKLVEAMFRLNLFSLFAEKNSVLEKDLIEALHLVPLRAQKWLHLLCCEHFLIKTSVDNQTAYQLPEQFFTLLHNEAWWGMQFFFNKWYLTSSYDLADSLQGASINNSPWTWPPSSQEQAMWLERWMTRTAKLTVDCILDHIDFSKIHSFLDIGGGDGTMACAFVTAYPHLKATVYNLPYSLELAKENIDAWQLTESIGVHEGNFLHDKAFPTGYDFILFARVLMDWGIDTSKKLLKMAYQALPEKGLVAICEIFQDKNHETCLSCEYGYIFQDDMDTAVMKSSKVYRLILAEIGFTLIKPTLTPQLPHPYCSLILARK